MQRNKKDPTSRYKPEEIECNQRRVRRIPIRKNEGVQAIAIFQQSNTTCNCEVIDMSTSGFSLISNGDMAVPPRVGDRVDLRLTCGDQQYRVPCTLCHVSPADANRTRLGLMRTEIQPPLRSPADPIQVSLTATAVHPYFYNETVMLRVTHMTQETCSLECDDPEFLVFPDMSLQLSLHIVSNQHDAIEGTVNWIETPGRGKTCFGMHIDKMTVHTQKAIVRYLFQLHDWKPRELREMGFTFKGYRPLIKFRSLQTHDEYLEVLKLRRLAYLSANKIPPDSKDTDLASELDRKSRILVAYHQKKLVGTVALLFPDREDMLLDTERTFKNGYPVSLPAKTRMIEIARLCITPDYRSTDILWGMFEHIYRILITSGRDYVLSSTDDHMWSLYRQMGFYKVGATYDHPVLKGIEHHVMLLQKNSALFGKNISPLVWTKLYSNMTDYLQRIGAVRLTPYQRARNRLNRFLYATAILFYKISKRGALQ